MTHMTGTQARFVRPPVREVALTVFFPMVDALTVSSMLPLLAQWQKSYPEVEERFPDRPRSLDPERSPGSRLKLPCPMVTLSDTLGNSISVQGDRLVRRWAVNAETYPGFDSLAADLAERFSEFAEQCRVLDVAVEPDGASCEYRNAIGNTSRQQAVGVLTDWQKQNEVQPVQPAAHFLGMHMHFHQDECSVYATINGADDDETTSLIIESETDALPGGESLGGLVRAHDALVATFLRVTSSAQHAEWGRKS